MRPIGLFPLFWKKGERLFLCRACVALAEVVRSNHFGVGADWPVSIILEKRNDCSCVGRVLPWLSVCALAIVGLRPVGLFPLFWKKGNECSCVGVIALVMCDALPSGLARLLR